MSVSSFKIPLSARYQVHKRRDKPFVVVKLCIITSMLLKINIYLSCPNVFILRLLRVTDTKTLHADPHPHFQNNGSGFFLS
jgi:hypothetical protein